MTISNHTAKIARFLGVKQKTPRMPSLGSRELDVMELYWSEQALTLSAQQALEHLQQRKGLCIGLNTMQSTLERLYRKELLDRKKTGRAFHYFAACEKKQVIQRLIQDIAEDMTNGDMLPIISGFMEYVASHDPELSNRLEQVLDSDSELEEKTSA